MATTKLFVATDNQSTSLGKELWATDGTATGTTILKNINPTGDSNPVIVAVIGAKTYFTATDGNATHGTELWVTDGTAANTIRLDRLPDTSSADYKTVDPASFAINGTQLLFLATDNQSTNRGRELWVTNGTTAGTTLIRDINPAGDSSPAALTTIGALTYFTATDGNATHNTELWATDGTAAGTLRLDRLADTLPADYRTVDATSFTNLGGKLLFVATDNQSTNRGRELWITNGTTAGTTMLRDINPTGDSNPANLTVIGARAYFTATDGNPAHGTQVWSTDGTATGTIRLDRLPDTSTADYRAPDNFRNLNGKLLFTAVDNQSTNRGRELWTSDGTTLGTVLLRDINPGGDSNPANFTFVSGRYYFTATDGNATHGTQLWTTDGTTAGTLRLDRLVDTLPGDYRSVDPASLTTLGTSLLFVATDNQSTNRGRELWITDGTTTGTKLISDINPSGDSNPANFVVATGSTVLFTATDGNPTHNTELWVYNDVLGTVTRLDRLANTVSADYRTVDPATITIVNGRILFVATDNQSTNAGRELWSTDGTALGTTLLKNINPAGDSNPAAFTVVNNRAYFTATDGNPTHNTELWFTDGTAAGTIRLDRLADNLSADYRAPDLASLPATTYTIAPVSAAKLGSVAGPVPFTFVVNRTGDVSGFVSLNYAVTGSGTTPATAADFVGNVLPSGTLSFNGGETTRTITVNIAGNPTLPLAEGFTVTLSQPNGTIPGNSNRLLATSTATGTIQTDVIPDSYAIATVAPAAKPEGNTGLTPFTFTVTRTGSALAAATLTYAVTGAVPAPADAADFENAVLPTGTVAFAAGETSKTITANIAGDTTFELDETFTVTLTGPTGTTITTPTATATITNDDAAPIPNTYAIAAAAAAKPEGNTGLTPFTFNVTRTGSTLAAATLTYAVAGTGTNPANASDFENAALPSGTVTFAAGEAAKTITVNVAGDTTFEPDEAFAVTLSGPAGTTITTPTATATITNDDTAPVVGPALGFVNTTSGTSGLINMATIDPGGPSYLNWQYIYNGSDDLAISTQAQNVFIHSGSGFDAIQVASGQNVLDGGLGSNFLTGGTGTDTFFTDARNPGVVWNTLRNFHAGDAATLWGFTNGVSSYRWEANLAGAAGSEGATLRANIVGGNGRTGDGIDASITFTGLSVAQAQKLQIVTGNQPAGNYLYIYNPGV